MQLKTVQGRENVPHGAVLLTREQALTHQRAVVRDWRKGSEVLFLRYGNLINTLINCASAVVLTHHFRGKFNLRVGYEITTYIPTTTVTSLLSYTSYNKVVTDKILLGKVNCPMCTNVKCLGQHLFTGALYPTMLNFAVLSYVVHMRGLMHLPSVRVDPKGYFRIIWDAVKSARFKYQAICGVYAVSALFLPYMQVSELANVSRKLSESNSQEELPA